ncbi:nuclear transport factor 2 family protein [Bacteroidota bacterium]
MSRVKGLFLSAIIAGIFITSCNTRTEMVMEPQMGETLVKQLWDDLSRADTAAISLFMANGFQSVHGDGAINNEQEIQLISGLSINSYSINDLICTQNGNVIITTYMVSVEETIEGIRLSKAPAARMSVFVKNDGKWQFLAHANLKPLKDQK